jgi:hypothetical protein
MHSRFSFFFNSSSIVHSLFKEKVDNLREQLKHGGQHTVPVVQQISAQALPPRDVYVKALFDNDPTRDTGVPHRSLPFRYGDIFHVTNMVGIYQKQFL